MRRFLLFMALVSSQVEGQVYCDTDLDCESTPTRTYCGKSAPPSIAVDWCVACITDDHCTREDFSYCAVEYNPLSCVECRDDFHCPPKNPFCKRNWCSDGKPLGAWSCFSATATVQVEGKGSTSMKDLEIGDKVLTGTNQYQPVYAFGHRNPTKEHPFLKIETEGSSFEVTPEHLLYLQDKTNPVRASSIRVGDVLSPSEEVTNMKVVQSVGLYAPLTPDGTIIVNGVLASSYVALQDNDDYAKFNNGAPFITLQGGIHLVLTPFRALCRIQSFGFCESYDEEGMPHYVARGIQLLQWADTQHFILQIVLFLLAFPLFGTLMMVEKLVFDIPLQTLIALGVVVAFAFLDFGWLQCYETRSKKMYIGKGHNKHGD